ncbi:MAG: sulfotransferase domain-containing protein [Candidatus Methylomirabilis oxyfera]|nr:sulfotransferase domain-containing protein [Candidatus Methylomirabilis oxyfera]
MLRDPRDIVVSWYFSARYSHVPMDPITQMRKDLKRLSIGEGLKYIIDRLDEWGAFQAQQSWMIANQDRARIALFRYEDLARDNKAFLRQILGYLDIMIPEDQFHDLYDRQRFERHSKGRRQGDEDQYSHYRKGASGDWRNHFDRSVMAYFSHKTGDLLEVLGYPE